LRGFGFEGWKLKIEDDAAPNNYQFSITIRRKSMNHYTFINEELILSMKCLLVLFIAFCAHISTYSDLNTQCADYRIVPLPLSVETDTSRYIEVKVLPRLEKLYDCIGVKYCHAVE
jgi:hypothetical protein